MGRLAASTMVSCSMSPSLCMNVYVWFELPYQCVCHMRRRIHVYVWFELPYQCVSV
jgi:hypothetical protein